MLNYTVFYINCIVAYMVCKIEWVEKLQLGSLEVVVPPDFIPEETSGDVMVPEGGTVKLTCRARGSPAPHVQWRREDGQDIIVRETTGVKARGIINIKVHIVAIHENVIKFKCFGQPFKP